MDYSYNNGYPSYSWNNGPFIPNVFNRHPSAGPPSVTHGPAPAAAVPHPAPPLPPPPGFSAEAMYNTPRFAGGQFPFGMSVPFPNQPNNVNSQYNPNWNYNLYHYDPLRQAACTNVNTPQLSNLSTRDNSMNTQHVQALSGAIPQETIQLSSQVQSESKEIKGENANIAAKTESNDDKSALESDIAQKVTSILCSPNIQNAIISQFQNVKSKVISGKTDAVSTLEQMSGLPGQQHPQSITQSTNDTQYVDSDHSPDENGLLQQMTTSPVR